MNWIECGRTWLRSNLRYYWHLPGSTEKNHKGSQGSQCLSWYSNCAPHREELPLELICLVCHHIIHLVFISVTSSSIHCFFHFLYFSEMNRGLIESFWLFVHHSQKSLVLNALQDISNFPVGLSSFFLVLKNLELVSCCF